MDEAASVRFPSTSWYASEMPASDRGPVDGTFPQVANDALDALTAALSGLVEVIPDLQRRRPSDISRALDVDMKLAWKVSHLAKSPSAVAAVRHLPGQAGMQIFLDAARRRGCPGAQVAETEEAFGRLWEFIRRTAGSRQSFEAMMVGVQGARDRTLEREHRRRMYEGASSVWGVQCETIYRMDVLYPSRTAGTMDYLTLRTLGDARRLRAGVSIPFPRHRNIDKTGTAQPITDADPIDPAVSPSDLPIVRSLCEGTVPPFPMRTFAAGVQRFESPVSMHPDSAPFTVVTGEVLRAVQPARMSEDCPGIFKLMRVRIPSVRLTFDVLVHRDLVEDDVTPDVALLSDLNPLPRGVVDVHRESLPLTPKMTPLEPAELQSAYAIGPLDGYIDAAFNQAAGRKDDYRCFRLEMSYPPVATTVMFECQLPG